MEQVDQRAYEISREISDCTEQVVTAVRVGQVLSRLRCFMTSVGSPQGVADLPPKTLPLPLPFESTYTCIDVTETEATSDLRIGAWGFFWSRVCLSFPNHNIMSEHTIGNFCLFTIYFATYSVSQTT